MKKLKILIALVSLPICTTASSAQSALDQCRKGEDRIAACTEVIAKNSRDAEAYRQRGGAYGIQGDYEKAFSDFSISINIEPTNKYTYYNRAFFRSFKGDLDEAIADYTIAINLDPSYADAYNARGEAWQKKAQEWDGQKKQNIEKAIGDYTEAIKKQTQISELTQLFPELVAKPYLNRAMALQFKAFLEAMGGKRELFKSTIELAISDCTESIKIWPKNNKLYKYRGHLKYSIDQFDDAIADYTISINLNPKDGESYVERGQIWLDKNNFNNAISDFTQASILKPDDQEIRELLNIAISGKHE